MEPERRIEKWLRAFAKKRREQAGEPMQLRESTRHRLQREVARMSEQKSHRGFFSGLFFGPRPRLVFAATFTALALTGWFVWRESTRTEPATLSMNQAPYPEITTAPAAPATPPPAVMRPAAASEDKKVLTEKDNFAPATPQPSQPTVVAANRSLAITPKERNRAESASQQKQLAVTTAPDTNLSLAYKNEAAEGALSNADRLTKDAPGALPPISALPPVSAPPASTSIAGATGTQTLKSSIELQGASSIDGATNMALFDLAKSTGAATVSQVFHQLDTSATRRTAITTPTRAPVLTSFRVEQSGNNLKVVDGDGSVYTGSVQIAQQEPSADSSFAAAKNQPAGAPRATKSLAPTMQNYFFRVAGTNRNLKANVVFSGNFVPLTNGQISVGARTFGGFGGGGVGQVPSGSDQAAGQPVQAVLSNSQITGNVVIGNQKAIDVIATPAK